MILQTHEGGNWWELVRINFDCRRMRELALEDIVV